MTINSRRQETKEMTIKEFIEEVERQKLPLDSELELCFLPASKTTWHAVRSLMPYRGEDIVVIRTEKISH
jgi:hypothetical protein